MLNYKTYVQNIIHDFKYAYMKNTWLIAVDKSIFAIFKIYSTLKKCI